MKRKMFIVAFMIVALSTAVYAGTLLKAENVTIHKGIRLIIDGEELVPKDVNGENVPIFVLNGTTYLPVRAVSNVFEKRVQWDGETKTVYLGEKPGEEPFMRLETYYKSGADSADERFVWEKEHMAADGEMKKNVVYPKTTLVEEASNVYENPAPYGNSPYVVEQAGDEEIVLNGQFKRFTAQFAVPKEAIDRPYYDPAKIEASTACEPAWIEIRANYMSGVTEDKTLLERKISPGKDTIDIDLDITNVKSLYIWMGSGQSHDGTTGVGMLVDPTFRR